MTDDELLNIVRKDREEHARFMSNEGKKERELWVAKEFLVNIGIDFSEE